jgi:superfamily II DNA or RNA helicase
MNYSDIIKCLGMCDDHINEGGGKITSVILAGFNIPDNIKKLIKLDYKMVRKLVDFYQKDFMLKISRCEDLIEALNKIEFIKIKSNDNKSNLIEFNDILLPWLKTTAFFINIYEEVAPQIINPEDIGPIQPISKFIPRENQAKAFERLESKGLETGIHCQATGCGKSFIIIRYCDYANRTITNPKIILFTERVNILADLFSFTRGNLLPDKTKLDHWKNLGIGDLTKFNIINRVTNKKKDWVTQLTESKGPTLLVINRAFLTLGKNYEKFKKGDINLVLHDECHNTSSIQCHELLKKCKGLDVPIIGFSATPLRSGKDDKPKLLEIYAKPDEPTELNLLTNYNMIYAISKELILPPEFYWYQIETYNKEEKEDENNNMVTQEDLGSVLELLNYLVPFLPNKKLVAWCGTIGLAKKWKSMIESNYKQRKNLVNFKFGLDTSETRTEDYDQFSKPPTNDKNKLIDKDELKKNDQRLMYWGNSILFCANKHREGSDIKLLDGCIFLDKVKNRGAIPFIQSIGRVLRLCPDTKEKTKGVVIDGFVKESNGYERQFVDKIIGYYLALENLCSINEESTGKSKYDQYVEMRDIVQFDKEKETISMRLGERDIKIHCNKLEWDQIIGKFDKVLQTKIGIGENEALLLEFNKLKAIIKKKKFVDKEQYYVHATDNNLLLEPEIKYKELWTNWYDFLGTDTSIYPVNKQAWKKLCDKYKINKEIKYRRKWNKYGLPAMPEELYRGFSSYEQEFNNFYNLRRL